MYICHTMTYVRIYYTVYIIQYILYICTYIHNNVHVFVFLLGEKFESLIMVKSK